MEKGNTEWLDRINYFSHNVLNSPGYWRKKRREICAWIDHHLEEKNGLPSFFITLSCAEYQWPDIEKLVNGLICQMQSYQIGWKIV